MTDKLAKSELTLLREDVDNVRAIVESVPPSKPKRKRSWIVRAWHRIFGRLIYVGEVRCAQCKFWKPPWYGKRWDSSEEKWVYNYGNCSLLFGDTNTIETDSCEKGFEPNKKFMKRVRR